MCDRWPWKIPPPPLILPTLERFLALKWLTVGPGFLFCLGVRPLGLSGIRSAWCPLLGTSILATSACETGRYGLWCDVRRGAFVERMHYHSPNLPSTVGCFVSAGAYVCMYPCTPRRGLFLLLEQIYSAKTTFSSSAISVNFSSNLGHNTKCHFQPFCAPECEVECHNLCTCLPWV